MSWYWVAAVAMLVSLSVGVTAVILQRLYWKYAVIDILAIVGFMIFTSTLVSLILTRLGFAFKRIVARSQWADMLGIITFRNSALLSQRPSGCFPCQPSPTQPGFCPDNSGDMLTIFEDYSQYPPQPRRLFDTHRLSPTTSPEGGLIPDVVPTAARLCQPDSEDALLYVVRSNGTFVHLDHIINASNCCRQDDLPPPYSSIAYRDHEELPPPYNDETTRKLSTVTVTSVTRGENEKKNDTENTQDKIAAVALNEEQKNNISAAELERERGGDDDRERVGSPDVQAEVSSQADGTLSTNSVSKSSDQEEQEDTNSASSHNINHHHHHYLHHHSRDDTHGMESKQTHEMPIPDETSGLPVTADDLREEDNSQIQRISGAPSMPDAT